MNGYPPDRTPYQQGYNGGGYDERPSPPRQRQQQRQQQQQQQQQAPLGPPGKMLVEGYRNDILNNFEREHPRYNPMNPDRPQSSALVDLKDPIQVHLLTETALSDSRRYEILSQEEVDELKKQCQSLTQRIEQTRQNLALQSKYRDAAMSMAKLYSPGSGSGRRRSLLGHRSRDSAGEAELESQACERRCEELASELWNLEKRIMDPQRRLLEHTAGILQLTHKSQRKPVPPPGQLPNGMPGSPESMYTYSNSRSSMDAPADDGYLDYQDQMDGMQPVRRPRKNSIEIPLKSPIREQANRLRDQELQFRAQADAMNLELDALRRENEQRGRMVSDLERKLQGLNNTLRDVIVSFNPTKNSDYRQPPYGLTNGSDRGMEPGDMVASQLEYLQKGLYTVKQEQQQGQNMQANERGMQNDTAAEASAAVAMAQAEGRMGALNQQIKDLLLSVNARPPPPPNFGNMSGVDSELDDQISYFQHALRVIETELVQATEAANQARNMPPPNNSANNEAEMVLRELWDSVQSGYASVQRQKEERRRYVKERGLDEDEDDISGDEMFATNEEYSLSGLVSRVRLLSGRLLKLTEQKCVLKRQIKQQRELNNKSDAEKDIEMQNKVAELRNKDLQIQARDSEIQSKTVELQAKLVEMQAQAAELQSRDSVIRTKDSELMELDGKVFNLENRVRDLEEELDTLRAKGADVETTAADVQAKDARLKELEAEVAETKSYLERARTDASQTQGMLLSALRDLDTANKTSAAEESEAVRAARAELEEKSTKLAALETSSKDLESRLNMTETSRQELQTRMDEIDGKIEALESELTEARATKKAAELASEYKQKELDSKQREIKEKDDVMENLNLMVVELKTELTIAKAELDGAYGSRAERAADVAAIKNSKEVRDLQDRIKSLETELQQTLKQLEDVMAETIKAEREKLDVEGQLDDVVAARNGLETEVQELRDRLDKEVLQSREKISKLQEDLDSERLKVAPSGEGAARPGAGASMLSEQFRATMREERKKFQEDMREEQSRRRKVEEELSRLRKAQGPGKSPLSPR